MVYIVPLLVVPFYYLFINFKALLVLLPFLLYKFLFYINKLLHTKKRTHYTQQGDNMDYLKCPFLLLIILKMTKKEIIKKLEEAQNYCDKYYYDECLSTLFEISNEDYKYYEVLQDFIDQDTAEEFLKHELEEGGLVRLYYTMGDVKPYGNEYVRINAYGNLEEVKKDDLQYAIDEIKDRLND